MASGLNSTTILNRSAICKDPNLIILIGVFKLATMLHLHVSRTMLEQSIVNNDINHMGVRALGTTREQNRTLEWLQLRATKFAEMFMHSSRAYVFTSSGNLGFIFGK
jgi:hypothetical protein